MDGVPKEQRLLKDGKESVVDATLKFPLVDSAIKRETQQLVAKITRTRLDEVPTNHPVSGVLKKFASRVAGIALRNPAGSPNFTRENWKQEYADRCTNEVVEDPDYDIALKESKRQILDNLPADKVQKTPKKFLHSDLTLALLPLANRASIVANMINSGNNPNLLELTPEEVAEEQDQKADMMQKAGKEVGYVAKNWPKRKR